MNFPKLYECDPQKNTECNKRNCGNPCKYTTRKMKASPYPGGDENVLACQNCKSGEYLYNEDGNRNSFCGQCGKAIDWGEEADT